MIVVLLIIGFLASATMAALALLAGYSVWVALLVYMLTGSAVTAALAVVAYVVRTPDESLSTRDREVSHQSA